MKRPFSKTGSPCDNIQPDTNPIHVHLSDGSCMTSMQTGIIPINGLPIAARHAHLFPYLKTVSLLSIGQLCESGCVSTFNKDKVNI